MGACLSCFRSILSSDNSYQSIQDCESDAAINDGDSNKHNSSKSLQKKGLNLPGYVFGDIIGILVEVK